VSKPIFYQATEGGDTWVYEKTTAGKATEQTVTVDAIEEKDGVVTVSTKRGDGGAEKVRVSAVEALPVEVRNPVGRVTCGLDARRNCIYNSCAGRAQVSPVR